MSTAKPSAPDRISTTTRTPSVRTAPPATSEDLRPNPLAAMFPPMPPDEFRALCEDIRAHGGLRKPITVHQGQVLDGLNRLRACREVGIEPTTEEWDGRGSIEAFVASINLVRRHLTPSQRALIAACWPDAPDAPPGRPKKEAVSSRNGATLHRSGPKGRARDIVAARFAVSATLYASARKLVKSGRVTLIEAVRRGDLDVTGALRLVELPPEELEVLLKLPADELAKVVRRRRADRNGTGPGDTAPPTAGIDPISSETAGEPRASEPAPGPGPDVREAVPPVPPRNIPKLKPRPRPATATDPASGQADRRPDLGPAGAAAVPDEGRTAVPLPAPQGDREALEAVREAFRRAFGVLEEQLRPADPGDSKCRNRRWENLASWRLRLASMLESEEPCGWAPCECCKGTGRANGRLCTECDGAGRGSRLA